MTSTLAPPLVGATLFGDLRDFGQRFAVRSGGADLSHVDLAERVEQRAGELGPARRLVLLSGSNHLESLVTYLAALSAGQPLLLIPGDHPGHLEGLVRAYDPDVVAAGSAGQWAIEARREDSAHDLHPDLALMLSTSGSTGSPKLVRLSYANLRANATSIAGYLAITPDDRAITSLPMHYSYGLSVVNSHLLTGAGLLLTDLSVVDERFWTLAVDYGATSFAGVPYTFDLLDQSGFAGRDLPRLRYVTQAGGRLAPERVVAYADLGRRRGWDFFVMYGQTEATARMAYLPPELALSRPETIGRPIPGGAFRIDRSADCAASDAGELIYDGPNVMMGYATDAADLSLGHTTGELRTGDFARRTPDGLFTLVGRKSRFAKIFGTRFDLDDVERHLHEHGVSGRCVAAGDLLWVFVDRSRLVDKARDVTSRHCGLPTHAVRTSKVELMPVTRSGKPDYAALHRHAELLTLQEADSQALPQRPITATRIRDLYAELLGRPDATSDSSFVSLGGDSLSYVELSIRLADLLDVLPSDWHTRTIRELARGTATSRQHPARWSSLDTSVLIRAVAIMLIVANHSNLFTWFGGAHVLLGVAGYNFARFQLSGVSRTARIRNGLSALQRIALPSIAWIGGVALVTGMYRPQTAFLLNGLLGSDEWTVQWQFWFMEALVWTVAMIVAVMAIPAVDRLERRAPFGLALAVLISALVARYALVGVEADPTERYMPTIVFWCFALGWTAAKADRTWQRLTVTASIIVSTYGFFGDLDREATVVTGLLVLLWTPAVRVPRGLGVMVGVVASSSLHVYLTHWQVYPHLEVDHPLLAVLASFAVGIAYWKLTAIVSGLAVPAARRRARCVTGGPTRPRRRAAPGQFRAPEPET